VRRAKGVNRGQALESPYRMTVRLHRQENPDMTLVNLPVELLTLIVNLIIPESWNESTDGCLKLRLICSKLRIFLPRLAIIRNAD
jgi:hypothetical protein